jgi:hypothetical protein
VTVSTNGVKSVETNLVFVATDAKGNVNYAITFNQDVTNKTDASTNATSVWKGLRATKSSAKAQLTIDNRLDDEDEAIELAESVDVSNSIEITLQAPAGYTLSDVTVILVNDSTATATYSSSGNKITVSNLTAADTLIVNGTVSKNEYTVDLTALSGYDISGIKYNGDTVGTMPTKVYYGDRISFTITGKTNSDDDNDKVVKAGKTTAGTVTGGVDPTFVKLTSVTDEDAYNTAKDYLGDRLYHSSEDSVASLEVAESYDGTKTYYYRLDDEGTAATAAVSFTVNADTLNGNTTVTVDAPAAE